MEYNPRYKAAWWTHPDMHISMDWGHPDGDKSVWQTNGSVKADGFHVCGRPINTSIFEEAEVVYE